MSSTEVIRRGQAYREAVEAVAPGCLTGLYLVGSAALGDWQERLSNVDVVAVADEWDDGAITAAVGSRPRATLGEEGGPCRVAFVTYAHLASPPGTPGPVCVEGARRIEASEFATPLTWHVLAEDAICLLGSEYFTIHQDDAALRTWAAGRLAGPWAHWVARAGRLPGQLWRRRELSENLLEVTRLHIAATSGQAVSKLRSGTLAIEDLPGRYSRVLTDALGYRRGSHTSMYWGPAERKHQALDLITDLTARAGEQTTGS